MAVPLALDIADDRAEGGGSHAVEPSVSSSCGSPANENHYPARRPPAEPAPASTLYEEFHPFGTSAYAANDSGIEVSAKRYRYIGKERDEETGLYHLGARYYASWLGRWTAADPIGLGDGVNRYAYARGNPARLTDPGGTKANAPDKIRVRVDADPGQVVEFSDGQVSVRALNNAEIESGRENVRKQNEQRRRSVEGSLVPTAKGKARAAAAKAEAEADAEARALYNDPYRDFKLKAARQGLGAATATLRVAIGILSFGAVGFDEFRDAEAREAEKETASSALVQFGSAAAPVGGRLRAGPTSGPLPATARASSAGRSKQPAGPGTEETVYRVQGGELPNASKERFVVDEGGGLSIQGDDMLHINLGQESRALEFLGRRGETAVLVQFEVSSEFATTLRTTSVPQRAGRSSPGAAQRVDETRAPDQFGIPASMFQHLLDSVVRGSVRTRKQ